MNAITRAERAQFEARFEAPTVTFTMNGREVTGLSTETIIEIADREGIGQGIVVGNICARVVAHA